MYYTTGITITITPVDAKITVDGITIGAGQKMIVKPGNHEIKITKDDYITYDKQVSVNIGANKTLNISLRLEPVPQKAVDSQAGFSSLTQDQVSIYYLSNGNTMYAIDNIAAQKLTTQAISPDFFSQVQNIIWAPNHEIAVVKEKDQTFLYDFSRYDLIHQELTPYENGIKDLVWSSDSQNIMYYYAPASGETTLVKASKTNTNQEIIYNFKDTKIRNPEIDWSPDAKSVLLVSQNKLYVLDLYTKKLTTLPIEKVVSAKFTPDNQILYLTNDSSYICDIAGANIQNLNIQTKINQIAFFDANTIIYSQTVNNQPQIYLYDRNTNTKTQLSYNEKYTINPINFIMTPDKKYLYFESNNYIYRVAVDTTLY